MKNLFSKTIFILLFFQNNCLATNLKNATFEKIWALMQNEYNIITNNYNVSKYEKYCHTEWKKHRKNLEKIIYGKPNKNFLSNPIIAGTMVRSGINATQKFEIAYLEKCISSSTKDKLKQFKDVDAGWTPHTCKEFNCSVNTLGHLFYVAKIFEKLNHTEIKTVVEFGGGYGNLAHVLKKTQPDVTIVIFDLPELIALQSVFLRSNLPQEDIIVHYNSPENYKEKAIHLIPIYLLEDTKIDADAFISNFALSETSLEMQNIIFNKNFFNANICYISGQFKGCGFTNHGTVFEHLRYCYPNTEFQPFHFLSGKKIVAYEAIATR
ncbi:putative sugar O-methyltransferase [Candidatus Dependentiae bacterium]